MNAKDRPNTPRPPLPDYMQMQQQLNANGQAPGGTAVDANRVIYFLTQQVSQQAQTIAMLQAALEAAQTQNPKGAKQNG